MIMMDDVAADYTYKRWFHKGFAKNSALDVFSCKFCLENQKTKCVSKRCSIIFPSF